jgi:hypothetical protein
VYEDVVYERRQARLTSTGAGAGEPKRAPAHDSLEDAYTVPLVPPAEYQAVPGRASEDAPAPPSTTGFAAR